MSACVPARADPKHALCVLKFLRMDIQTIKKAHFIGIGGIGVSAILRLFASRNIEISGSDLAPPALSTLPQGTYHSGHNGAHVPPDADLVIYSPAVPETNPERVVSRERNIPELSYPEALALVTAPYNTIAVSGTHGKSTTTALLGKLFEAGGLDASVVVGAEVPGWDRNLRIGASSLFIVEACEYRRHMMHLTPQAIVLTNLELDHPDYYHDLSDMKSAFREYIEKLTGEDLLIINNDDVNLRDITRDFDAITVRYGIGEGNDLSASNVGTSSVGQTFDLFWKETPLGTYTTPLPGIYNIYNILGAVAAYLAYGGSRGAIAGVIAEFSGIGRRFEVKGKLDRATIISDYAHHPTALEALVKATRERFPDQRLLTVFRPHQKERTKKLMSQFVDVIAGIPHTLLVEIYDVAGREELGGVSSHDLIRQVKEKNPEAFLEYADTLQSAEAFVRSKSGEFDIILVAGAGDADQLAECLVAPVVQQGLFEPHDVAAE